MGKKAGKFNYSEEELKQIVEEILHNTPQELYSNEIVSGDNKCTDRDRYFTNDTHKSFFEVIVDVLKKINENKTQDCKIGVPVDVNCTYNNWGKRKTNISTLHNEVANFSDYLNKCQEPRLIKYIYYIRGNSLYKDGFKVVDYQVTTTNGGKTNIDVLLSDDEYFYMTEAKWFSSKESLLRCILEIQTYYEKLNQRFFDLYGIQKNKLKKAVLVDKNSAAFAQKDEDWAKELIKMFDIVLLELCNDNNDYLIKKV